MRATFLLQVSLLLSALSTVYASDGYPVFSWNRVPVSAHVGLNKGLTPEEYKFLADHFNFITFTGGAMDSEYRINDTISFELLVKEAASTVKKHNPKAKVLAYWAAEFEKPHHKISNAFFPKGATIKVERNSKRTVNIFDTTNEDVRNWWADVAGKFVHEYSCNGIFVDGATAFRPGSVYEKKLGKAKNDAVRAGTISMMEDAKKKMGDNSLVIFNPLHGPQPGQQFEHALGWRYLSASDGAMIDDFDRAANLHQMSKEYMANTIEVMSKAAKNGNIIIFKAWPGFTWWSDREMMKKPHDEIYRVSWENITYPLGCFLVGAEQNCYFCYTWGWLDIHGTFDWYPEFDKQLGPPKGEAIREGWTYQREFAHASVFVDLEKKTAKIDWH